MLLAGLVIGGLVGFSIAAIILTSACSLVRVPPPDFFFAMVLCFVISVTVFLFQFAAGVAGTLGAGVSLSSLTTVLDFQRLMERGAVVGLLSTPFVSAGIYSAALRDCSYRRGLLIWVAQFVVIALFLLAIWGVLVALGLSVRH
jgi:hypothetical protein